MLECISEIVVVADLFLTSYREAFSVKIQCRKIPKEQCDQGLHPFSFSYSEISHRNKWTETDNGMYGSVSELKVRSSFKGQRYINILVYRNIYIYIMVKGKHSPKPHLYTCMIQ